MTGIRPTLRLFCKASPVGIGFHPPVLQEESVNLNGDICWVTIPVVFEGDEGVTP